MKRIKEVKNRWSRTPHCHSLLHYFTLLLSFRVVSGIALAGNMPAHCLPIFKKTHEINERRSLSPAVLAYGGDKFRRSSD